MPAKPPKPDELEVSLFGPGRGECVVVHLGQNDWMIVDSCRDQRNRRHPALAYLREIGVNLETDVRLIVTSHWHDDHVNGLAEVVRECVSADVWTSLALRTDELLLATGTAAESDLTEHNPFREFYETVQALDVRSIGKGGGAVIKVASAGKTLFRRVTAGLPATVEALSPSDTSVMDAMRAIAANIQNAVPQFSVREPRPNEAAIALRVEVGGVVAILGADLEESTKADRGWQAIVQDIHDREPKATIFKVPHHGSVSGHSSDVWDLLLVDGTHATLTPYRNSRLPRDTDIQRIKNRTPRVHLTATATPPSAPKGSRTHQSAVRASSVRLTDLDGIAGHVRLRTTSVDPAHASVDLYPPARSM